MLESNFWQDKANSKKVIKEKKLYEDLINSFETSIEKLKDSDDLRKLALEENNEIIQNEICLLYTSPSPRDATLSRMPSSA